MIQIIFYYAFFVGATWYYGSMFHEGITTGSVPGRNGPHSYKNNRRRFILTMTVYGIALLFILFLAVFIAYGNLVIEPRLRAEALELGLFTSPFEGKVGALLRDG